MTQTKMTLCWDCKKACGGCRWSDKLLPVPGWTAKETTNKIGVSYIVLECPQFERDGINGGVKRYKP